MTMEQWEEDNFQKTDGETVKIDDSQMKELGSTIAAAIVQALGVPQQVVDATDQDTNQAANTIEATGDTRHHSPGKKPTIYDLKDGRQSGENLFETEFDDISKRTRTTDKEKRLYGEYVPPPPRRVVEVTSVCKNCDKEERVVAEQVSAIYDKDDQTYKHMCIKCSRGRGRKRSR